VKITPSLTDFTAAPKTLARLVCRPALPADTPQVMEIARLTWGGHDYLSYVWDDWLQDHRGLLQVAELGGNIVGCSKLSHLAPGQGWLHGLRVHADYQDHGIARKMWAYGEEVWKRMDGGTLRFVTSPTRVKVHHLAEANGYHRRTSFRYYRGLSRAGKLPDNIDLVTEQEIETVFERMVNNPLLPPAENLWDLAWEWCAPDLEILRKFIIEKMVYWWGGHERLIMLLDDGEMDGERYCLLGTAVCQPEEAEAMLHLYLTLANHLGYRHVGWNVPFSLYQNDAYLLQAELTVSADDEDYICFEKN